MSLAITVNDADFSDNSIGWEAPTSVQPSTALFALNGASGMKNLASGGVQPAVKTGAPVFTAGVAGKSLPSVTLGYNEILETYQLLTPQITILSLANLGTGNTNIINMPDPANAPASLMMLQRGSLMSNWLACGDGAEQLTENADGLVAGSWQIHALQCDITTTAPVLNYKNYTTGISAGGTGKFSKIYTPTDTLELGGAGDSSAASMHETSMCIFWESILSADDLTAAVAWVRQWAKSFGQSV